jgi:DNA-binding GntR family transcriptional regulator
MPLYQPANRLRRPETMQPRQDLSPPAESRASMADTVHAALHAMLLTHRLPLDTPLSERLLAAELGVSRTPLREALRRMEGEGMLARLPGGLLSVRRIGVEEFLEVLQMRRLLEGEAAAAAAGKVSAARLAALRDRLHALQSAPAPDEAERLAIDLDLHAAILAAAANATMARILADLRRRMLLFARPREPDPARLGADHLAIIDALARGDADAARQAMAAHVDALRAGILRHLATL